MPEFSVKLQSYENLSPEEQMAAADNGHGKEWANYVRVTHNGQTLYLENDAIEPEDKSFGRDLGWIVDAILQAYELGRIDGSSVETPAPRGKPCTCDNCLGSSTSCRVEAGERLGDLWYCRKSAEAAKS